MLFLKLSMGVATPGYGLLSSSVKRLQRTEDQDQMS